MKKRIISSLLFPCLGFAMICMLVLPLAAQSGKMSLEKASPAVSKLINNNIRSFVINDTLLYLKSMKAPSTSWINDSLLYYKNHISRLDMSGANIYYRPGNGNNGMALVQLTSKVGKRLPYDMMYKRPNLRGQLKEAGYDPDKMMAFAIEGGKGSKPLIIFF